MSSLVVSDINYAFKFVLSFLNCVYKGRLKNKIHRNNHIYAFLVDIYIHAIPHVSLQNHNNDTSKILYGLMNNKKIFTQILPISFTTNHLPLP